MQRHKKLKARILSLALSAVMVCTMLPTTVFAIEAAPPDASGFTECHPAHDEDCGYTEAVEGTPCSHLNEDGTYSCAPIGDEETASPSNAAKDYVCDHKDGCGYEEGEKGSPCTHSCDECQPEDESLIPDDALMGNTLNAEWTVTGWQDTYTIGESVDLSISYPDAAKYGWSGFLPEGLSIANSKDGSFYVPENGALHISGTTTEAFSNKYAAVTAFSDRANLGKKVLPFVVVASSTTIAKAITIGTAAPVKDASVADGTNQAPTGAAGPAVTWSADDGTSWAAASGTFAEDTAYQTKYVYTAQSSYVFDSSIANTDITVTNLGSGSVTAALTDSDKTLTVTVTWPATEAGASTTGDFTVAGGTYGTDYSYANNTLTILTDTPITISGTTSTDKIVVDTDSGKTAQVTLNGMDITTSNAAPLRFEGSLAKLHLTLEGTNALTAEGRSDYAVQIQSSGNELTIDGDGSLAITSRNRIAVGTTGSIALNGGTTTIKTTGTQNPYAVVIATLTLGPNMEAKCNTGSNTDYHEEAYVNSGKFVTELNGSTGAADVKITAAAVSAKRTTPLDLETDAYKTEPGVVESPTGVYTNETQKWSYDSTNKVLTLSGVDFESADDADSILNLASGTTIVLEDGTENTLKGGSNTKGFGYAIRASGSLTINGSGTLNATAYNTVENRSGYSANSYGIQATYLTVGATGTPTVNANGGNATANGGPARSYGIMASSLRVKGGTVTAKGAGTVSGNSSQRYGIFVEDFENTLQVTGTGKLLAYGTDAGAFIRATTLSGVINGSVTENAAESAITDVATIDASTKLVMADTDVAKSVKIMAATPPVSTEHKRTTPLDLSTISTSNTMGATYANGVYTNDVEKWVYDTTKSPAELILKGVDIEVTALSGIKTPDGTLNVIVEAGTVNNINVTRPSDALYSAALVALGYNSSSSAFLNITGTGALNVNTTGETSIAIGTISGTLTIAEAAINAKASGTRNAYGLYGQNGLTISSGSIYAAGDEAALFTTSYTIADSLELKGSTAYDDSSNLQAATVGRNHIEVGGATAKTVKIAPASLDEIILGTTLGYANTEADLRKAMADIAENGVVKLSGDITITDITELKQGKFVLDLGSHTIIGNSYVGSTTVYVNGADLTIRATTGGYSCQ